jgi:hypothetical protein
MANNILHHPIISTRPMRRHQCNDTYSVEELRCILEHEEPFFMAPERLETIINGTEHDGPAAALRAYLVGIHDARQMVQAVRPDIFCR